MMETVEYVVLALLAAETVEAISTPDPFQRDVKIQEAKRAMSNSTKGILMEAVKSGNSATPLSMAAESVITFVSVFVVGCVITLSVFSWQKFKPESWRMSVPSYQYSALNQVDNDQDDEAIDPGNQSLEVALEESTSDEEVVNSAKEMSAKAGGDNKSATLAVNASNADYLIKNGSNLMECTNHSSRLSSTEDDVFLSNPLTATRLEEEDLFVS